MPYTDREMRLGLRCPKSIHDRVVKESRLRGTTISDFVSEAIEEALLRATEQAVDFPVLKTGPGVRVERDNSLPPNSIAVGGDIREIRMAS